MADSSRDRDIVLGRNLVETQVLNSPEHIAGAEAAAAVRRAAAGSSRTSPAQRRRFAKALVAMFLIMALIGVGAWLFAGHPAAGAEFLVKVSGSPAIQFRGACRVVSEAGAKARWTLKGTIPKNFKLEGSAVWCTVLKWDARGRLTVRLLEDRRLVALADTAAPFNTVSVRTSGPWGEARARRGVRRIPFSISPGPSRGLVPPLPPGLVPSLSLPIVPPLAPGP